ncbi:deoxyribodipyrimidine photo-lyase [Larsenimonas rhizosphaerae]|uniref:Deoxyribodipyrimidine photo-lyase n=1 Tax=Larsenimonas rhizosphaerae TaxID=2944682 RepID=A0AA42CYR6_9GAMM|nr:deoxyribodipyrimidine photo-lyase [Larsenimonas rhizosphaerae]MCX2525518.1 deoxyribodipyrimidine photo-lyase [Larsenimonas rhizosphaerae]
MSARQLVWFRTDLRTHDNSALAEAARQGPVIAVITLTRKQWKAHGHGDNKLSFWYRGFSALADDLDQLNIPLKVLSPDQFSACPEAVLELAQSLDCQQLHFNNDYGINERNRDDETVRLFKQDGRTVQRYDDGVIIPPGDLLTGNDEYYKVFTPFYKAWLKALDQQSLDIHEAPSRQKSLKSIDSDKVPAPDTPDAVDNSLWPAGTEEAEDRLERFLGSRARHYKDRRDFPFDQATSTLSPYLALGMISPRQCLTAAIHKNGGHAGDGDNNLTSWISELAWRDFYQHVLVGFPKVSRHEPFKSETRNIKWRQSKKDFKAWCEGNTGYPLVDAAMKQLVQTGWMHNRLRMVTAMFLTKHLLIDWHWGEAFFLEHLVDGELGANNGGWQWSASTGTDASPYFRIFNPTTQSKRFDPAGRFIIHYLPALSNLSEKHRHEPTASQRRELHYPETIVDHRAARERALETFKSLK